LLATASYITVESAPEQCRNMSILKTLPSECQFFHADWWTPSQPLSYDDASVCASLPQPVLPETAQGTAFPRNLR
jgi:hypothetical protein